jgi:hypothetical protein
MVEAKEGVERVGARKRGLGRLTRSNSFLTAFISQKKGLETSTYPIEVRDDVAQRRMVGKGKGSR